MKIENIKLDIKEKEIMLGKDKILVKQYLQVKDKSDIMNAIKDYCFIDNLIDQPKMDALFNTFIVLNYTNIKFEFKSVYDLLDFYDYMETNNYIHPIIGAIPEIEYNALIGYYENTVSDFNKFKTSTVAAIMTAVEYGPELMEKIGELSKEIDMDAIKLVAEISEKMN